MVFKISECDAKQVAVYSKLESKYEFFPIPELPSLTQARVDLHPEALSNLPEDIQKSLCVQNNRSGANYYIHPDQLKSLIRSLNPFTKPLELEPGKVRADLLKGFQKQLTKLQQSAPPRLAVDDENYVRSPLKLSFQDIAYFRSLWHQDGSDVYSEAARWIITDASRYGELDQSDFYFSRTIPQNKFQLVLDHLEALIRTDREHPPARPLALKECLQAVMKGIKGQPARFTPFFVSPGLQESLGKLNSTSWEKFTESFVELPKRATFEELSEKSWIMSHEIWLPLSGRYTREELTLFKLFLDDKENNCLRIISSSDHEGTYSIALHRDVDFLRLNKFLSVLMADAEEYQFLSRAVDLSQNVKLLSERVKREDPLDRFIDGGIIGTGFAVAGAAVYSVKEIYHSIKNGGGPSKPSNPSTGASSSSSSPSSNRVIQAFQLFPKNFSEIALLGGSVLGLAILTGAMVCSPFDGPAGEIAAGMATLERGRRFFQLLGSFA